MPNAAHNAHAQERHLTRGTLLTALPTESAHEPVADARQPCLSRLCVACSDLKSMSRIPKKASWQNTTNTIPHRRIPDLIIVFLLSRDVRLILPEYPLAESGIHRLRRRRPRVDRRRPRPDNSPVAHRPVVEPRGRHHWRRLVDAFARTPFPPFFSCHPDIAPPNTLPYPSQIKKKCIP